MPMNRAARTLSVKGEEVPEREPDRLTHAELEAQLAEQGIIAGDPALAAIRDNAYRNTLELLAFSNGLAGTATKAADSEGPGSHTELERGLVEQGLITRTLATANHRPAAATWPKPNACS